MGFFGNAERQYLRREQDRESRIVRQRKQKSGVLEFWLYKKESERKRGLERGNPAEGFVATKRGF